MEPKPCSVCYDDLCCGVDCLLRLEKLKANLLVLRSDIMNNVPLTEHLNVCGQTGFISLICKEVRKDIFDNWEFFSGNFMQPVPAPEKDECLYDGIQGRYRLHLVEHILVYLGLADKRDLVGSA
jgi:hypothetical protein